MTTSARLEDVGLAVSAPPTDVPARPGFAWQASLACVLGIAAAWLAAGSAGLLAHPLRHALTGVACLAAALLAWPPRRGAWPQTALLLAGVIAGAALTCAQARCVSVWGVAVILASLAWAAQPAARDRLRAAACAVALFALYRTAVESIPLAWLLCDWAAGAAPAAAGEFMKRPLVVGISFGGLDFMVLSLSLLAMLLLNFRVSWGRIVLAVIALAAALALYLVVLARVPDMREHLTRAALGIRNAKGDDYWLQVLLQALPWNLPALAGLLLLPATAWMLACWPRYPARQAAEAPPSPAQPWRWVAVATALAFLLPVVSTLCLPGGHGDLTGKRIVLFEKGFLNWEKPQFGKYGRVYSGMYGMMPDYLVSMGARCEICSELSEAELADADVVAMFFPDKPWLPGQLERVHKYVKDGGSLLVLGEHTTSGERGEKPKFNQVLSPTGIQVAFDGAEFEIGGWLHSYQTVGHPATAGISDVRNEFGVVIGASLQVRGPANPLLIGQWGYSDVGDAANTKRALLGDNRYNSGERLGDLVLAAEQKVGKGRMLAFGDTSGFCNGVNQGSHRFTGRIFNYLANPCSSGHEAPRQLVALAVVVGLAVLIFLVRSPSLAAWAGLAAGLSFLGCVLVTERAWQIIPDGRLLHSPKQPLASLPSGLPRSHNLAYVDTTHAEWASEESWRINGTGGMSMNLMRAGYLTLNLPRCTSEYLDRCQLLATVSPMVDYSPAERDAIVRFVKQGGYFICVAGYEQSAGCRTLLEDFGIRVGFATKPDSLVVDDSPEAAEPICMGFFKSPYLNANGVFHFVRFHAAWPVGCIGNQDHADPIAYGRLHLKGLLKSEIDRKVPIPAQREPRDVPTILMRRVGAGKVVVIGDSAFAHNRNLEWEGGQPFEGKYENAEFWRFLLAKLQDRLYVPPKPETEGPAARPRPGRPKTQPASTQPATTRPAATRPVTATRPAARTTAPASRPVAATAPAPVAPRAVKPAAPSGEPKLVGPAFRPIQPRPPKPPPPDADPPPASPPPAQPATGPATSQPLSQPAATQPTTGGGQ